MKSIENRKLEIKKLITELLVDILTADDVIRRWPQGKPINVIEEKLIHEVKHYAEDSDIHDGICVSKTSGVNASGFVYGLPAVSEDETFNRNPILQRKTTGGVAMLNFKSNQILDPGNLVQTGK